MSDYPDYHYQHIIKDLANQARKANEEKRRLEAKLQKARDQRDYYRRVNKRYRSKLAAYRKYGWLT